MAVHRRDFLKFGAALAGMALLPGFVRAQERFIAEPGPWRKFEIVTHVAIIRPQGRSQAWVPVPSVTQEEWSVPQGSDWTTNAKIARLEEDPLTGTQMAYFEWPEGEAAPYATVSSHAETRDRLTDFTRPRKPTPLTETEIALHTAPSPFMPQDAALQKLALSVTEKAKTDLGKSKAIYEWVVENRQCDGDMLDAVTQLAGDRCDRLNILYTALARASGLAARNVFGLRVAPSLHNFTSLGAASDRLADAQHCRAEVWLESYGWVPVDPADVHRAMKLEDGAPGLEDPRIVSARVTLFGGWEGNWVPLNMAERLALPDSGMSPVAALQRPVLRSAGTVLDLAAPNQASFTISAAELPA